MKQTELLAQHAEACNYPGRLDESAATAALERYVAALGIERQVMRLRYPWWADEHVAAHDAPKESGG